MANRSFVLPSFQLEKQVVRLYAQVTFGASGAPTLVTANSKGILSVTRNSAGKYTFVFGTNSKSLDLYYKLLELNVLWDATKNSGTAPAAPLVYLSGNTVAVAATCNLQIVCTNTSQTATDPASTEQAFFEFVLSNSGAT